MKKDYEKDLMQEVSRLGNMVENCLSQKPSRNTLKLRSNWIRFPVTGQEEHGCAPKPVGMSLAMPATLYLTNKFHVAVRLFSNRSQKTSKCGKNISDKLGYTSCATFLFLPHFDVISDLLLNRRTSPTKYWSFATCNLKKCWFQVKTVKILISY